MAANDLEINGLLNLACEALAYLIRDGRPKHMRQMFRIDATLHPRKRSRSARGTNGIVYLLWTIAAAKRRCREHVSGSSI
ncbi:hypothetical protein HPB48_018031 [Haemaphysalis longicornis]|uniref:SKP1 component dimerisation domain-containing protein n=1 Tax=Haemaphysalis longicornis TaxID=44386 RepID=A0A9J6FHH3_HAELO|nr:hypothetical protein HPB48_018031 [Haemaphysalis longicornis]